MSKRTKVTFTVPEKLWAAFLGQTKDSQVKSSGFLVRLIESEVPELDRELEGKRLSANAKAHLKRKFAHVEGGTTKVNVEMDATLRDALDRVIKAHNLMRDSFITRLIMLALVPPAIRAFAIPDETQYRQLFREVVDSYPPGPLEAMQQVINDPLYLIRHALEEFQDCGLYVGRVWNTAGLMREVNGNKVPEPERHDWAVCYLEDEEIPGTPEWDEMQKHAKDLLEELMGVGE